MHAIAYRRKRKKQPGASPAKAAPHSPFTISRMAAGFQAQTPTQKAHTQPGMHYRPAVASNFNILFPGISSPLTSLVSPGTTTKTGPALKKDFPDGSTLKGDKKLRLTLNGYSTCMRGDKGPHIGKIQHALLQAGYRLTYFGAPRQGIDQKFGRQTKAAIQAFQADAGLIRNGIVDASTIAALDKQAQNIIMKPTQKSKTSKTHLKKANIYVKPGAPPSKPNRYFPARYGYTDPEYLEPSLSAYLQTDWINFSGNWINSVYWKPNLDALIGHYSLQTRVLPFQKQIKGPGQNTNQNTHCDQLFGLKQLGKSTDTRNVIWYMEEAVLAHERIHATRLRPALINRKVWQPLYKVADELKVPVYLAPNETAAIEQFNKNPKFKDAKTKAKKRWDQEYVKLIQRDHRPGGATDQAERRVVTPMIRKIEAYARQNGWISWAQCSKW